MASESLVLNLASLKGALEEYAAYQHALLRRGIQFEELVTLETSGVGRRQTRQTARVMAMLRYVLDLKDQCAENDSITHEPIPILSRVMLNGRCYDVTALVTYITTSLSEDNADYRAMMRIIGRYGLENGLRLFASLDLPGFNTIRDPLNGTLLGNRELISVLEQMTRLITIHGWLLNQEW